MAPLVVPGVYELEGQLCLVSTLHAGMVPPRGRGAVRTRRDGRGRGLEAALKVVRVVSGTWSYLTSQFEHLGWRGWYPILCRSRGLFLVWVAVPPGLWGSGSL